MNFVRDLCGETIKNLQKERLFKDFLRPDIEKGEVFPAIRNNEISFYYRGGGLFNFKGNVFSTNIKYAGVPKNSVTEDDLKRISTFVNFCEWYKNIKEQCYRYNRRKEVDYVAKLYQKSAYVEQAENIILLDIEAGWRSLDKKKKTDYVDAVLYDKDKGLLQMVEVKRYSNSELRSIDAEGRPKVVGQIKRYEEAIEKAYAKEICEAYYNYQKIVNAIFDRAVFAPKEPKLNPMVNLLIVDVNDAVKNTQTFTACVENIKAKLPGHEVCWDKKIELTELFSRPPCLT